MDSNKNFEKEKIDQPTVQKFCRNKDQYLAELFDGHGFEIYESEEDFEENQEIVHLEIEIYDGEEEL